MVVASVPSAFMSDVGLVGMFIPVVRDMHARTQVPVRRLLMPLAIAATLGGLLTMVGSTGNIVANMSLTDGGYPALSLFSVTPYALILLAFGILFMTGLGRWLVPRGGGAGAPLESEDARSANI